MRVKYVFAQGKPSVYHIYDRATLSRTFARCGAPVTRATVTDIQPRHLRLCERCGYISSRGL